MPWRECNLLFCSKTFGRLTAVALFIDPVQYTRRFKSARGIPVKWKVGAKIPAFDVLGSPARLQLVSCFWLVQMLRYTVSAQSRLEVF